MGARRPGPREGRRRRADRPRPANSARRDRTCGGCRRSPGFPTASASSMPASSPDIGPRLYVRDIPSGAPRPVTPEGFFTAGMTRTVSPDGRFALAVRARTTVRPGSSRSTEASRAASSTIDPRRERADALDRGRSRPLHPGVEGSAVSDLSRSTSLPARARRGSASRPRTPRVPRIRPACASRPTARRASTRSPASSRRSTSWTGCGKTMPSRHDWGDLLRSTFHDVGREDISGLYSLGVEARQGEADRRGPRRARRASPSA